MLSIWGLEFEVVSDANQLNALFGHFALEIFPIVTAFGIIVFVVDGSDNVCGGEPPLAVLLVPNGPNFSVVKETYGLLGHDDFGIKPNFTDS